jgi:hypothetical protein
MQFSRLTVALTLSSTLLVSACTGADDPDEGAAPSSPTAVDDATGTSTGDDSTATGDAGTATTDVAAATDDASSTTVAMATDEGEAVLGVEEAEEVAARLLQARYEAFTTSQRRIKDAQQRAYMSTARTAAEAQLQLQYALGPVEGAQEPPAEPNVLAISRDDGELPQFLLVQTVPESGVPHLHLMESRTGETKDFRIIWEAPMLPGTELPTFDRRSVGTPVLRSGQGDLVEAPRDTLKKLAAYVSWPQPDEDPGYDTKGYAEAVREAAQEQADAVAAQAGLREKNWLVSDDVKTLMFEDGSAFVIGSLLRDTTFSVNSDAVLTPPESFLVFGDDAELTDEAVLRTSVFVAMRVPAEGQEVTPTVIAAREQLVDAWGS